MPKVSPPKEIASFEIVRRLGAGGMAEVFLAKKPGAEGTFKVLVLKRILPTYSGSRRFRAMFIEEAQLATRLNHPNVVQVYELQDFGDEGLLLAMEHVDGCDLGRLMTAAKVKGVEIPCWVGAWIIAEAAKGLHYAHEKKDEAGQPLDIVHRDVSPQNVLLSFDGSVKIADFGIATARLFAEEEGVLKGKFGYMSPEQARGEVVDRRSDLYALGVIFWEILAGRPIHGGLGGEALLDIARSGIVEHPTTHAPSVPPALEEIVLKVLSSKREERYATGRDLSAAIGKAIVKQGELIDAATLEQTLAQLVRGGEADPPRPADSAHGQDARTQAAAPLARMGSRALSASDSSPPGSSVEASSVAPAAPVSGGVPPSAGPREVRHVGVLMLRLHGMVEAAPQRAVDRLRAMLDGLAFKREMLWIWDGTVSARAIAGLGPSSSRAASDAVQLALDVHEALSGFEEHLPSPVTASIGIVRGIATGTRDKRGHLVHYLLESSTEHLAGVLGRATPMARTWVAGGVYRLVRRDFRWGDAPTLSVDAVQGLEVPPTMRVYALERSLSREERLAEAEAGANDLVGRDAEKADLHAAFHESVGSGSWGGQIVCRAVVGEMGIGKTALVASFLVEIGPQARLIHVECTPVTLEVPYA
ncbi:MAG: protein kinase domain-containing protein, partial [Polyangiaceae bacterium]